MVTYSIAEAEGRLSELVEKARTGEIVTLTREGEPVAVVQPVGGNFASPEMLDLLAEARTVWRWNGDDAATIVRNMRDETD